MLIGATTAVKIDNTPFNHELLQKQDSLARLSGGEFIDRLAKLSGRLLENKQTYLSKDDVFEVFNPMDYQIAKDLFTRADTDKDGKMSRKELIGCLFGIVSKDADGKIDRDQFQTIITAYAKFLDVNLKRDWKKKVDGWFKHISNGDGIMTL